MRRHDLLFFIVTIGGLSLACLGAGAGLKPLVAGGSLLAGTCAAVGMVRSQVAGVIRTNRGTLRRAEDPVGFWIESAFWWIVILLWTLGGAMHGFGLLVK